MNKLFSTFFLKAYYYLEIKIIFSWININDNTDKTEKRGTLVYSNAQLAS